MTPFSFGARQRFSLLLRPRSDRQLIFVATAAHAERRAGLGRRGPELVSSRNDQSSKQNWTRRAVLSVGAAIVSPILALVVLAGLLIVPVRRRRQAERRRIDQLHDSLAEVVDLVAVAIASGHNMSATIHHVSQWIDGEIGDALRWCCDQVASGHRLGDTLAELPSKVGEPIGPLAAALVAHERYGALIQETLVVLAADARATRRRRAETAARRLPVAMLFPLVVCVLPAFMLLTVVPVMAEALSSLWM